MKIIISLSLALLFSAVTLADEKMHNKAKSENTSVEADNSLILSGIFTETYTADSTQNINAVLGKDKAKEWYVGVSFGHARMKDDKGALIMGLQGGWILNRRFVIGAAGYGFMNGEGSNNHSDFSGIRGGYGGLLVAPVFWGTKMVQLSIPVILGGGGISNSMGSFENNAVSTGYFIFVPGVEVDVNVAKHFKIAATFNYRITSSLKWQDMGSGFDSPDSNYVNGPSINLILKFGQFIKKK